MDGLRQHLKVEGMAPKVKRSGGRKNNAKTFSIDDFKTTKQFVEQYANTHGLLLPGRTPGFRRDGVLLLPSCETKVKVHNVYLDACSQKGTFNVIYALQDCFYVVICILL